MLHSSHLRLNSNFSSFGRIIWLIVFPRSPARKICMAIVDPLPDLLRASVKIMRWVQALDAKIKICAIRIPIWRALPRSSGLFCAITFPMPTATTSLAKGILATMQPPFLAAVVFCHFRDTGICRGLSQKARPKI